MLLRGATNKQIAADLQIGEKTVKNYMTILMQKLHARNRLEVLIAAQKLEVDDHHEWGPRCDTNACRIEYVRGFVTI